MGTLGVNMLYRLLSVPVLLLVFPALSTNHFEVEPMALEVASGVTHANKPNHKVQDLVGVITLKQRGIY